MSEVLKILEPVLSAEARQSMRHVKIILGTVKDDIHDIGKTTTLRMIAGREKPDAGQILIGYKDVTWLEPYRRSIGYAPQRISLFPHMNVYDNVAFGVKMRHAPRDVVDCMLQLVHTEDFKFRHPFTLSGGQV